MDIPEGYEIQVRPRSGLSAKTSLRIANSIGTVDQDYQGDVSVIIWNASDSIAVIKAGDRIAQAELVRDTRAKFTEVFEKPQRDSNRSGGFGSTGLGATEANS